MDYCIMRFCVFCGSNTLRYRLLHIFSNMQLTDGLHSISPTHRMWTFQLQWNFFFNYDVTNRKLYMSEHTPLYENE